MREKEHLTIRGDNPGKYMAALFQGWHTTAVSLHRWEDASCMAAR